MAVRRTDPLEINQVWTDPEQSYKPFRIVVDNQGDGGGTGSRIFEVVVDDVVVFAINSAGNVVVGGEAAAPVTVTAATLAVTEAAHGGRTVILSRAAGITVTLPAATGGGAKYDFIIGTDISSNAYIIKVTTDDTMKGSAYGDDGDGEPANGWPTAADTDTVTMGGTGNATGGLAGDRWTFVDIAADKWAVLGFLTQGGTEATPFSATVT